MAAEDGSDTERQETDDSGTDELDFDVSEYLSEIGFDPESNLLTRRQAEVLVLREHGYKQTTIAAHLGTSRANVSGIETNAHNNIEKARETVTFAERLSAPIRVEIPPNTDLHAVPDLVFDACDEVGVKVSHTASDLMKIVSDAGDETTDGQQVHCRLFVHVTSDGKVSVRSP